MFSNLESRFGSGEKSPSKDIENFFFQLSNLSESVFVLENLTHQGLETAVYSIFAKAVLDIFAVCSLGKADLRFFLSYRLKTTIKITIFSTFYVAGIFSSCFSRNSCKKNTDSFNKKVKMQSPNMKQIATEVTTYIIVRKKQKSFCEIAP